MNEQKEKGAMTSTPKKPCSRCKDHTNKDTSVALSRKPPSQRFSGLKFNFKVKKVTITQPFSFDMNSKNESKSPCRVRERSVEKPVTTEGKDLKDAPEKRMNVIMDTLKISKSTGSESPKRSRSPNKTKDRKIPKSSTVDGLTSRKPCSRCSSATTKEKSDVKPTKVATDREDLSKTPTKPASPKIGKPETQQPPKTASSKKVCSKLARLQTPKSKEENQNVSKPKSNVGMSAHSEVNTRDSTPVRNSEKSKNASLNAEKPSVAVSSKEKSESSCLKEKKAEFVCSKAKTVEEGVLISEVVHSSVSFKETSEVSKETTSEYVISNADEHESKLMNGTQHETESIESEILNETRKECDVKSTSKIPRIAHNNSGQKIHASIKKEMMAQAISFENVCPNMNQPTNHMEDILV